MSTPNTYDGQTAAVAEALADSLKMQDNKLDAWHAVRTVGHSGPATTHKLERAFETLLIGWCMYADAHRERYGDGIGSDYVLGNYWESVGRELHNMLDGEVGSTDCGDASRFILAALQAEGFSEEA